MGVKLKGAGTASHRRFYLGATQWLCIRQSGTRRAERRRGQRGKEHLGDEATMKLVQLLLGEHQPVSLSKASST